MKATLLVLLTIISVIHCDLSILKSDTVTTASTRGKELGILWEGGTNIPYVFTFATADKKLYTMRMGDCFDWGIDQSVSLPDILTGFAVDEGVVYASSTSTYGTVILFERDVNGDLDFTNRISIYGTDTAVKFGTAVAAKFPYFIIGQTSATATGTVFVKSYFGVVTDLSSIQPSDGSANDGFGISVSTNADFIIVGSNVNKVYIYSPAAIDGTAWNEDQIISGTGSFGTKVAINTEYGHLFISAPTHNSNQGRVYVYHLVGASWEVFQIIENPQATGGFGTSISAEGVFFGAGTTSNIGYTYTYQGGLWVLGDTQAGVGDFVTVNEYGLAAFSYRNSPTSTVKIVRYCVPECGLIGCGNDGCGGTCGDCTAFETCSTENSTCVDLNECEGCHLCSDGRTCQNHIGATYTCSPCPAGYNETGPYGCVDIDECEDPDLCFDECMNIPGSYLCINNTCSYAFTDYCVDNQCSLRTCYNGQAGYTCGPCPSGYTEDDEYTCVDINECNLDTHQCDPLRFCLNNIGGYSCLSCPDDYEDDGLYNCIKTQDCSSNPCSELQTCYNVSHNGYYCGLCPVGYETIGDTCEDIDECETDTHLCQIPRFCTNTIGSYTCSYCPLGLSIESNYTCADVNSITYGISGFPGSAEATVAVFIALLVTIISSIVLVIFVSVYKTSE